MIAFLRPLNNYGVTMNLALRHHEEQKLIARNVVAELSPLWLILDFHKLEETTPSWLKATRPIIERGYLISQYVAAEFVKNYRRAELPDANPLQIDIPNPFGAFGFHPKPDRKTSMRIMVSMKVNGPLWVAHNTSPGVTEMKAAELMAGGMSKSAGAAVRLVLNGGRGMVRMLVSADRRARGVVGVADEEACANCQFLTNPILKSDGVRKMDAVAVGHDFCNCSAKPIY